ncbi:MAG: 23S rRNA (adenine(2503)-C(2))-methyltransferase RlmN [Lentisphaeria bacterium]|nr:23S rRNA (adenine(2503)-C(2))-methyltransferase RlmN [Lentisphaeria bacterium]
MMKRFLVDAPVCELAAWLREKGEPAFRAKQITDWIFGKLTLEPEKMKNLPAGLRKSLAGDFFAPSCRVAERVLSPRDGVVKLRLELHDGESVELVVIPARERVTLCLSTQVGCPVGCRFCASGVNGLVRNLRAGEMLEEFLLGCAEAGRKCDNIVFMGIGEGLLNFDELVKVLETLTAPEKFAMSPRRITVSTSGFVPGILKLAALEKEFTLAVSLHAPDDVTRAKIIPDKLRYPVAEILEAADVYREKSGRLCTLEYTLLEGVNDSPEQAEALGRLAVRHRAKVNLIPYNETSGAYRRPRREVIENFERTVAASGAAVTRRVERGSKSAAACGQLRARAEQKRNDEK